MKYKQNINWYKNEYLKQNWEKRLAAHYIFHFSKNSLAEKDIQQIVELKEKQHTKITKWLGVETNRIIDCYLYNSIQEKTDLMGDNSPGNAIWDELDLETNPISKKFEIHAIYNEKCQFIGEHEDAHLLSLPWGLSIYIFCEGLAQYMENSFMGQDLHEIAKNLAKQNKLYSLEWLCDNKNWENVEPTIIYPQAGSSIKYLIETFGKEKFKELYQGTSRNYDLSQNLSIIEKIYSKTLKQLRSDWLNGLQNG